MGGEPEKRETLMTKAKTERSKTTKKQWIQQKSKHERQKENLKKIVKREINK